MLHKSWSHFSLSLLWILIPLMDICYYVTSFVNMLLSSKRICRKWAKTALNSAGYGGTPGNWQILWRLTSLHWRYYSPWHDARLLVGEGSWSTALMAEFFWGRGLTQKAFQYCCKIARIWYGKLGCKSGLLLSQIRFLFPPNNCSFGPLSVVRIKEFSCSNWGNIVPYQL